MWAINALKKHKYVVIITIVIIAFICMLSFFKTFSEDVSDTSWDGVVSNSFSGGTGTLQNPYIIDSAGEFAYFKSLLEGNNAAVYAERNYIITSSFNYGEYNISINNEVAFTGTIDGNGNTINNASLINGLFNSLDGATIKNINFTGLVISNDKNTGIISSISSDSTVSSIVINGNVEYSDEVELEENEHIYVAGLSYIDSGSTFSNVVINTDVASEVEYISLIGTITDTTFNSVLVNSVYNKTLDNTEITGVYDYTIANDNITVASGVLDSFILDDYQVILNNNQFRLTVVEQEVVEEEPVQETPSLRSADITVHATGKENGNIYINDLISDYNYYMGLNYTEIRNTTGVIPDGTNHNYYDNTNLATVYIRYTSSDLNDANLSGKLSPNENYTNYYYFKRMPVENGYIEFDLIDNPWADRPSELVFNGWVTDYTGAVVSLDIDTYVRHVKVPVSDITNPISITFYTSWTLGSFATTTTEVSNNLKSGTMTEVTGNYGDLTVYYIRDHIDRNTSYPSGTNYTTSGTRITAATCTSYGGCDFVHRCTSNLYNSSAYYYTGTPNGQNITLTRVYPTKIGPVYQYSNSAYAAGLFVRVTSGNENIYSSDGTKLTSCNGTCYKLLQYSDGQLNTNTTYYYLPTRDTNIFAPSASSTDTSNITVSVPMTITGINNGTDNSSSRSIRLNSNWTPTADLRVEHITFYTEAGSTSATSFSSGTNSYKIIGNYRNLKLGRGLRRNGNYLTATSFVGGSSSSQTTVSRYSLIVESGFYENGAAVGFTTNNNNVPTHRVVSYVTLGNDFDRISTTNSNLIVYFCYAGSWSSALYNTSSSSETYDEPSINTTVKSGSFGYNQADYSAGIYVGGRQSGTHHTLRYILVEGGYIYTLLGGPVSATGRAGKNDIIIHIKGGSIDWVFGGAGVSNTVGSRILSLTGGTINYSVLGGSNAYQQGSNNTDPYGKIDGDVLLYVGGTTVVGTQNGSNYNIAAGNVFGAGNGRENELDVGSVNNSTVIIDTNATISGNVFGGGNFGAVGGSTSGSSGSGAASSGVYEDGTTDNNIRYYGSNPDNYIMFNGERYRIIGLFNNVSTTSGNKNLIRIMKGTYASNSQMWNNVSISNHYANYYVRNDSGNTKSAIYTYLNTTYYNTLSSTYQNYIQSVNWSLGATDTANRTASAFYTAERSNTASSDYSVTSFNYNIGLFYPSDYGFAADYSSCSSYNLSEYSSHSTCYSNNWLKSAVTANAWTMTQSTYYQTSGYGNNRRYYHHVFYLGTNNNINRNYIYYNSATNYDVYPSFYLKDDVTIVSGDGSYNNPYVIGTSDDLLTDIVYEVMHPSSGSGGGEQIIHDDSEYLTRTSVQIKGGTINGSVYGAGNKNGSGNDANNRIALSKISIEMTGGTIGQSLYGGSNDEGIVHGDVFINVTGGEITQSVYGGGKGGYDNNSDGTYVTDNVFVTIGDANTQNLRIRQNVYGGSAFGTVNAGDENTTTSSYGTTVTINNGIINGCVFGGGQGDSTHTPKVVGNINVTTTGGEMNSVYGGNDQAGSHTAYNEVHLNGGIIEDAYGGGRSSSVSNTHITLDGAQVTNLYGGSNTSGAVSTTDVNIISGSVVNIYGGNNAGGTCGTTDIDIDGTASITGTVYGGGKSVATTTTYIDLQSVTGSINKVYGGGESASVTTATVENNGVTVNHLYGGSYSSGTVTTANIIYNSGTSTNVFGGNDTGGSTVNSNIDFYTGTVSYMYGGGNLANGGTSDITIRGGTVTHLFGGGNSAGLTSSTVHVITGNLTEIYGGSYSAGTVTDTEVVIDNTVTTAPSVYGGGYAAAVGDTSVTINGGTFTTVYGGGYSAQASGDTIVDLNGGTVNGNVYGGGYSGAVGGDTEVTITDTTVLGSAYAGGNGLTATVVGNTTITIDGSTVIGTNSSVPPHYGSVFGGGNQAYTGTENDNVTATVNIVGGTIYGNVYGGANTSVIYGSTVVNIGDQAMASGLTRSNIYIKGHVFGGGEANASGSETYDWNFISVTEGTSITVDGTNYNDLTIGGSFYGGGNASSASGDSYLLIKNYGTRALPKRNISIQRVKYVTLDHSYILLKGAIDRANDYDTELFAVSRVDNFKIKNNTDIYFETGANLLNEFESLDSSGNIASVTINKNTNTLTRTVDNRVYMYEGRNLNIALNQQVTDYGEVHGMSFLGIYNYDNDQNINTGIYSSDYDPGDVLDWAGTFSRGSYVLGSHMTNHDITVNGFYSNFMNEETYVNEVDYIQPTPASGSFYMWFIGENVLEVNVNLVASKYSTLGAQEVSFLEFNKPNTSFQILSLDSSEIASGISLIDKNNIPRIANNVNDANTKFGLSMEATNNGWLTTGKTNFYTSEPSIGGVTYYEGENSTVVPTMLFYLYHSKNITLTQDLGTVHISVMAITKINALSNEIKRLVINVNMSTAMFQTVEYEGAMTPGDKYELFASTDTNITTKSKLSAYYSILGENTNLYPNGYHRVLSSTFVLPIGTKITMLDFGTGTPEYYYHVIDQNDYDAAVLEFNQENECSYAFSLFTRMGSKSNNSNYSDAAKNQIYYDGTNSYEEFIFIVDFGDTTISQTHLGEQLLIVLRDANEEDMISVLGIQQSQLTYNLYAGSDAQINATITPSDNPLYIGYSDIFSTVINYNSSTLNGVTITDTQYFDYKLGAQIYIKNNQGNVISGTDLTGTYFMVDNTVYYPDINGYTHIKLANKVGNTQKWLIFNTENSTLPTGSYTFVIELFASPDGIYYSDANPTVTQIPINIISSVYGLNPVINDESVIFSGSGNDKDLKFNIAYTSLLTSPNIRVAMYRRQYDEIYDTGYDLVDLQDYVDQQLFGTANTNEYLLIDNPNASNQFTLVMNDELLTGTYRLAFRLYDNNTMIGEIIRYIIIK